MVFFRLELVDFKLFAWNRIILLKGAYYSELIFANILTNKTII